MFKDKLRNLREDKDITQVEMADFLNITQTGYSSYERGRTEPDLKTFKLICQVLKVSADELLELNPKANTSKEEQKEIIQQMKLLLKRFEELNK